MRFKTFFTTLFMSFFLFCVGFNSAMAQNFNIDFGTTCGTPANTYGAAGQAGVWNGLSSLGASSPLTDITGVTTPATVIVTATAYGNSCSDCSPPVNALVGDYFYTSIGTWSVDFSNLTDGDYTVFIYGPSESTIATGIMDVNGVSVPMISGDNCNLLEGTSYVAVPATVTGGILTISGASSALYHGLAGIQLQTTSASIPTMTQWGLIIFVVLAGFGAVYFIRRKRRVKS